MSRTAQASQLSEGQAHYVMQRLVREGRISSGEVTRYLGDVDREIGELEAKLQRLRSIRGSSVTENAQKRRRGRPRKQDAAPATASPPPPPTTRKRRRSKRAVTPEVLASRKVQGRYLALIRQIPVSRRGQYSKVAKEKGRETAIAQMEGVLKK